MTEEGSLAYNDRIEKLRNHEFPMLRDDVYLDHAGTTLCAKSLVDKFAADLTTNLFGNPHSGSTSSQYSTSRIEDVRLRVLQFFGADPADFDVVFVANATAGIKLVSDAFRAAPQGFNFLYHQACHTSVVGVRQEARNSLCFDTSIVDGWIRSESPLPRFECPAGSTLFAYPAQSNMDGQRFPVNWSSRIRKCAERSSERVFTLLDAAAYAATSPLDLSSSETAPDFIVVSFYKLFGFPDLGALIVRRQATDIFQYRRYFGGGTVDMVVCVKEQWHAPKTQSLHESLEDGTLPIHNIVALDSAFQVHRDLFGSMNDVAAHTSFLGQKLREGMKSLRHDNDEPVCIVYPPAGVVSGPIVAFNLHNHRGAWVSLTEFEKLATLKKFHIRTGGLCNPGGISSALSLEPWEIKRNFSAGFRCGNDNDIMSGKPTGVIRVSLGAMNTLSDVEKFISFVNEFYRTRDVIHTNSPEMPLHRHHQTQQLHVETISVYPIKSCGGFHISKEVPWEVRPEGLAWDREWCLVHRGNGQTLSQKRYPRMALIRPVIDFTLGQLKVSYCGPLQEGVDTEISVPLSANPALFQPSSTSSFWAQRVCGEEISAQIYKDEEVNSFFTTILGVSCFLARFPPGGLGKSMRHAKAHPQKHQKLGVVNLPPNPNHRPLPGVATPPDSDSEVVDRMRILLSNESPILAINLASLETLNREIVRNGGKQISADVFRANVVIGSSSSSSAASTPESFAYTEDHWSSLRIGQQQYKMLGACRRCHMVCIDQETANKSDEPFVTLAKTRRFDGKVFFGTHMCHVSSPAAETREVQFPTIMVGDQVLIDPQ